MKGLNDQPPQGAANDLRNFPRRGLTIILCIFLAFVPLAYSPEGAEFDGRHDDFYYKPKLTAGLYLLALAAVFYLLLLLQKRIVLKYNPVFLYAGVFLAALTVAAILSPYPRIAFWGRKYRSEGLLAFLMYAGAFFLFATSTDTTRRVKTYLCALLVGAGVACAYGLLQFFGLELLPRDYRRVDWWRAFATSGNPGFLSAYLLLALPFPLLFFLFPDSKAADFSPRASGNPRVKTRGLLLSTVSCLLSALIFSCILATYHRGAWVGLAAGLVAAIILLRRKPVTQVSLKRVLILVAVLAACTIFVDRAAVAMGRPSLLARASAGTKAGQVDESTIRVRTYIWRATLPLIARRPAFGWGPDTMGEVFPEEAPKPAELGYSGRMHSTPDKPENLLLQIAYEGGLAALTPFIIMLGLFLTVMWRSIPNLTGSERLLTLGIMVGCVSYLAQQQFSFSTLSSSPVFWSLLGLGLALSHYSHPDFQKPGLQAGDAYPRTFRSSQ